MKVLWQQTHIHVTILFRTCKPHGYAICGGYQWNKWSPCWCTYIILASTPIIGFPRDWHQRNDRKPVSRRVPGKWGATNILDRGIGTTNSVNIPKRSYTTIKLEMWQDSHNMKYLMFLVDMGIIGMVSTKKNPSKMVLKTSR